MYQVTPCQIACNDTVNSRVGFYEIVFASYGDDRHGFSGEDSVVTTTLHITLVHHVSMECLVDT